jgi:hypothetical protein
MYYYQHSLQYLLLLTEVLFTVLFTDSVFTVHYYANTVQVLFTDYTASDLLFLQYILLIEFLLYIITKIQYKYFLMITTHSLVLFTVRTLVFT